MGITTSLDFIERQTLVDAISAEFVRNPILLGTPAVVTRSDLATTIVGRKVTVPYWDDIGEFVETQEDQAVVPRKITQNDEESTVKRASLAIQVSHLAEIIDNNAGGDMYEEIAKQVRERAKIYLDNAVVTLGLTTDLIYTAGVGAGAATPTSNLTWIEAIKASALWTDDGDTDPVMLGVHRKPWIDLLTQVDSQGRPLMANAVTDGKANQLAGIPLRRSSRLPVNTTPNPDEYTSILARARAMALWYAPPMPESDKDILVHSQVLAFHMYYVSHLYKRVADNNQKGVVKIISW
jgi:HK97 family phage major capsid protein